jgi:NAD(P)H-nitrite reductase large subunit
VAGGGLIRPAFIEKMLTLDTAGRYFIRTCGEEPMVAYNRVGLTGQSPVSDRRVEADDQSTSNIGTSKIYT